MLSPKSCNSICCANLCNAGWSWGRMLLGERSTVSNCGPASLAHLGAVCVLQWSHATNERNLENSELCLSMTVCLIVLWELLCWVAWPIYHTQGRRRAWCLSRTLVVACCNYGCQIVETWGWPQYVPVHFPWTNGIPNKKDQWARPCPASQTQLHPTSCQKTRLKLT